MLGCPTIAGHPVFLLMTRQSKKEGSESTIEAIEDSAKAKGRVRFCKKGYRRLGKGKRESPIPQFQNSLEIFKKCFRRSLDILFKLKLVKHQGGDRAEDFA